MAGRLLTWALAATLTPTVAGASSAETVPPGAPFDTTLFRELRWRPWFLWR